MRRLHFPFVTLTLFLLALQLSPLYGTLKYKKQTGKKCTFCHTSIPQPGDEDPRLTKDGQEFKENGYKLTEEQKKKPSPPTRRQSALTVLPAH